MRFDARKYSTAEQALIRRLSVQRVFNGERPCDVTKAYGLSGKVIFRWIAKAKKDGLDSLAPLPRPGRTRTLTQEDEREVKSWIVG
ncbi:MAG: helix-turn-helix domain-containing protein, partial [Candidatus Brocadiaceae bacterium]|nr:helix-turn-helix domain-containing protein [Candidatus Brocadiaceae bacterium]